jgi:PAS domain S-box-containing protein
MRSHETDSDPSARVYTPVERFAFLARAGELLAFSLDYAETLREVARLTIPTLGDLCIVDVIEAGEVQRVATAHVNPAKVALLEELQRRYPPAGDSPQPAGRVLRTGRLEVLEHVTPDVVAAHTRDEDHARLIRAIGIRSHLAVPLVARGVTIGVISLGVTESDRRYGPDDVALAQDLARTAALAVDNARLHKRTQDELAERARAEEALRLSEQRFRAIMEQSPLSTQILAPDGRTLRVNRAWEVLWGATLDQIRDYNILADPQLEARGIAPLLRKAFDGEAVRLPTIRYDPNETIPDSSSNRDPARWVGAFAYPVKDADGSVREVVLIHEDVTDVRRADSKLRASEERLQRALVAGRLNVWDWNLATDVVECSENAKEFWGIDIGRPTDFAKVIHPEDVERVTDAASSIGVGKDYAVEYRLLGSDGQIRWVQSRGRLERAVDGGSDRVLGVTVDITELKRAEETTRLLADAGEILGGSLDYHATLQNLARLVVPRIADWCAIDLLTESGDLERMCVYHPDPARVAQATELFARYPPARSTPYGAWHVMQTREPEWSPEISEQILTAVAQDARHLALLRGLNLRSYISVPLTARGNTLGVLSLVYAESGRRYRESDLALVLDLARRAAAAVDNAQLYQQLRAEDRRKDEFLATLAHELRNPLAPIRTGLALLRLTNDPKETERTREVMDRQLRHMVRLIDDLLDLSRITRGRVQLQRERVDVASIVGTAVEASRPLIDGAGHEFSLTQPESPIIIDADRTRVAQVLSNLLNNAAKFTPRGGRIALEVEAEGGDVILRVRDTGVGIPRQMLTHVFEMFSQVGDAQARTQSGLGIGLTLVKRLVELHDGRVWAESDGPGLGSTFVVRLPRATDGALAEAGPADAVARPASARRVLVVDDNTDAAEMLAALLEADGHDVRTAFSGPAALEIAEHFHPHIAFLDIGMPGMSGYELARRLRALPALRGTALIAVSGWGQDEDRRRSAEAGLDHHLTKPVDPRAVQQLVEQITLE